MTEAPVLEAEAVEAPIEGNPADDYNSRLNAWLAEIAPQADALDVKLGIITMRGVTYETAFSYLQWAAQSLAEALGTPITFDVSFGPRGRFTTAHDVPEDAPAE